MRRLYQKIYLVFLASLIAVVAIGGLSWRMGQANLPHSEGLDFAGELVLAALPPAAALPQAQHRAVERLGPHVRVRVPLFLQNPPPVAAARRPLPPPPPLAAGRGPVRARRGAAWR